MNRGLELEDGVAAQHSELQHQLPQQRQLQEWQDFRHGHRVLAGAAPRERVRPHHPCLDQLARSAQRQVGRGLRGGEDYFGNPLPPAHGAGNQLHVEKGRKGVVVRDVGDGAGSHKWEVEVAVARVAAAAVTA